MLTYTKLKNNALRFQAVTSITLVEFQHLLPVFVEVYAATQSNTHTQAGHRRQRQAGAGRKAKLATIEDKLLFILIYHKTYPLQTVHGLQFGLSQSQTNDWLHRLLPLLQQALEQLGYAPECDPLAFGRQSPLAAAPLLALQIDGTERRRRRPKNPEKQRAHYSGKKKPTRTKT